MSPKVSLMRSCILAGAGIFALACGSSSNSSNTNNTNNANNTTTNIPREQSCTQAAQAVCAKVFSCPTTDPVVAVIQANLGTTMAGCLTMIQQTYCSSFQCARAEDYHGDKAAACKQQFTAVTCPALSSAAVAALTGGIPTFLSSFPGCSDICTSGDAATGG